MSYSRFTTTVNMEWIVAPVARLAALLVAESIKSRERRERSKANGKKRSSQM